MLIVKDLFFEYKYNNMLHNIVSKIFGAILKAPAKDELKKSVKTTVAK